MTGPGRVLASLGSRARKTLTAAAAAVFVLGAVSTSVPTEAAWTDSTRFAAPASAGTWTTPTPANSVIVADSTTTAITGTSWDVAPAPGNLDFCVSLTVTGKSTRPTPWELRADLRKPPFNGVEAGQVYSQGVHQALLRAAPGDPSTLVITGKTGSSSDAWDAGWNNALLTSSQTLQIRLCTGSTPIPPQGDASWYTTSVARGEWTAARACKVLTVTGRVTDLAANPFYFTWVASVDLTDAKQRIVAGGRTVNEVAWTPHAGADRYQFSTNPGTAKPVADRYALTGGRMTAIRGTDKVTITACVLAN